MKLLALSALLALAFITPAFAENPGPNIQASVICPVATTYQMDIWLNVDGVTAEVTTWGEEYIGISWLYDEPAEGGLVELVCSKDATRLYLRGQGKIRAFVKIPSSVVVVKHDH